MATEETGDRRIQMEMDSSDRFYEYQLARSLNPAMIELIQRQQMVFVATADAGGNCDCSPRFGEPGFVHVVVTVDEAYIHCSKHVPLLEKLNKKIEWGTDDPKAKSSHYFAEASCSGRDTRTTSES